MALAFDISGAPTASETAPPLPWRIAALSAPDASLAREWDALADLGVGSPYQGRGWVSRFLDTAGKAEGQEPAIVTIRDGGGRLLGLFPLAVRSALGARVAGFVGDKHANYHLPLLTPEFAASLDAERTRLLLRDIAAALGGIDAFHFINQPADWAGRPHPLAAIASWPAAQQAHALELSPDAASALERSLSKHARKTLRSKRRKLDEIGASRMVRAGTEAELDWLCEAFLRQKAARFREMGIADPFAAHGVMEMLKSAALPAPDGAPPSVEWHGLALGDRVIAVFIGAVDRLRYAGMATSFENEDDAIARTSPGELLLADLILDQGARGRSMFDLGVGDARYKTTFCDQTEALVETILPFTLRGRIVLARAQALRAAKHAAFALNRRWPGALKATRGLVSRLKGRAQASTSSDLREG